MSTTALDVLADVLLETRVERDTAREELRSSARQVDGLRRELDRARKRGDTAQDDLATAHGKLMMATDRANKNADDVAALKVALRGKDAVYEELRQCLGCADEESVVDAAKRLRGLVRDLRGKKEDAGSMNLRQQRAQVRAALGCKEGDDTTAVARRLKADLQKKERDAANDAATIADLRAELAQARDERDAARQRADD